MKSCFKYTIVFLLFIFECVTISAQVAGTITDCKGIGIADQLIVLSEKGTIINETRTDQNGDFAF